MEALNDFSNFEKQNELRGNYDFEAAGTEVEYVDAKESTLIKFAKNVLKNWRKLTKNATKSDCTGVGEENIEDENHSKKKFKEAMQEFLKEALPSGVPVRIFKELKNKKNLQNRSNK